MTPDAIAALVARHAAMVVLLRANGQATGLVPFGALPWGDFPWSGEIEGFTVAVLPAHVLQAQLNDLPGGNPQVGRRVTIAAAALARVGWPAPPRKGDLVQIGSRRHVVQGCDTRSTAAGEAVHVLAVTG